MIFRLITCGKCMINRSTSTHFSLSNKRNYLLSPLRLRDLFIKSPILMSSQIFSKFPSTYSSSSPIRRRVSNISLLESVGFGILVAIGATEYFLTNEDIQEMVDSLEQRDSRWLAPVISGVEAYFTMRKFAQEQVKVIQDPYSNNLLPALHPDDKSYGVLTVVLDLDETLVCIDWKWSRGWIVSYRPGVQTLLQHLGSSAEVVVYTDLSSDDARKIVRMMDVCNPVRHVLTQNANKFEEGKYYRDLSKLNRDLSRVIYISGHALENSLQLENCVPIKAWKHKEDSTDTTLVDLLPFLESVSHDASDVREIIRSYEGCEDVGLEFSRRERQKQLSETRPTLLERVTKYFRW